MSENKNVPQWILDSSTGIEQQNDAVGLIVADFIGAFRRRGFNQNEIGMVMAQAFLLSLEEVEKRMDAVLSCDEGADSQTAKNLCIYTIQKECLFDNNHSDPCGLIELLKTMYGGSFTFEAILTYPELLRLYKEKSVRNSSEYATEKAELDSILDELERVYRA